MRWSWTTARCKWSPIRTSSTSWWCPTSMVTSLSTLRPGWSGAQEWYLASRCDRNKQPWFLSKWRLPPPPVHSFRPKSYAMEPVPATASHRLSERASQTRDLNGYLIGISEEFRFFNNRSVFRCLSLVNLVLVDCVTYFQKWHRTLDERSFLERDPKWNWTLSCKTVHWTSQVDWLLRQVRWQFQEK